MDLERVQLGLDARTLDTRAVGSKDGGGFERYAVWSIMA
jgi:hypothetical protein